MITSEDFQTRQGCSVKDSAVQTRNVCVKLSLNFISLAVEDVADDYVGHLFALQSNYIPGGFLPCVVRCLINACVYVFWECICVIQF